MCKKHLVFSEVPQTNNSNICISNVGNTFFADVDSVEYGIEILQFIYDNIEIIDNTKQLDYSKAQHLVSVNNFSIYRSSSTLNFSTTLQKWWVDSDFDNNDINYNHYLMVSVESFGKKEKLNYGNISIEELLTESEDSNKYFFSKPFIKKLISEYGPQTEVVFGIAKRGVYASLGFRLTIGENQFEFFDVSYDPPYGRPEIAQP